MQPPLDLPVLLISAASQSTAANFIAALVNAEQAEGAQAHPLNTVWEIDNKYYKASVRVYSILDSDNQTESKTVTDTTLTLEEALKRAEAHVIVMAPNEEWLAAQQRIAFVKRAKRIEVRVCVGMEDGVRDGYECVELASEAGGMARVREALQANMWRGMTLHRSEGGTPGLDELLNGFSSDEENDGTDNDNEDWGHLQQYDATLEQATRFIEQAGQVREMAQGSEDETQEQREARLRRAVGLLAAFCRFGDLN